MNGSSGFRGVPLTGGGNSGSSTGNHNAANDMNSALRSHHPYFPRLESLASPLYNAAELTPAGVAAAAAASRLFPAAHLSALHAAAVAAASTVPQTTTTHHGMPPPSLSQFHQAAAAAAAAANHHSIAAAAHHPLLTPFLYPHLSSPAAYGSQPGSATGSTPTTAPPPFLGGHPRHPPYRSPIESAFVPAANIVPPTYRYLLPSTSSPSTPTVPLAHLAAARFPSSILPSDRSLSESGYPSVSAAIVRARRPSSPAKVTPSVTNIPTSLALASSDSAWPSGSRPSLPIDQRPPNPAAATSAASTASTAPPDAKSSASVDAKKQPKIAGGLPTQPYYPSHFMKGTVIQLANGDLKRVEDLNTEDFVRSAHLTSELKIDTSQVVRIEEESGDTVLLTFSVGGNKVQVSVEATVEHPFFVIGQGWSSFNPERSRNLYGLPCQRLQVGDVCISLTHRDVAARAVGPVVSLSSSHSAVNVALSSGGHRVRAAASHSIGTVHSAAKPLAHSLSSDAIKQHLPGTSVEIRRSCNEDDDRSRKRRKMTVPLRIGEPLSQFESAPSNLRRSDRRSAMTPPGVSGQTSKTPKVRRWSSS